MTNEEAKKMLKAKVECFKNETSGINHDCNMRLCDGCSLNYEQGNMGEQKEALDMAIKALEQTELNSSYNSVKTELDCVSREAVQDLIAKLLSDYLHDEDREKIENVNAEIGELPSVTSQRKRGKWIAPNTSPSLMMMGIRLCSECNYETQEAGKFCTNCGAEMDGDTDDNMDASNNG